MLISSEATADSEEAGNDVGRDGHELGLLVGVAETGDNGGQEDGDGVERGVNANGDQHVDVDLPVLEGILHELHLKPVGQDGAVFLEAAENLLAVLVVQELGSVGVVVHDEEGHDS